MDRPETKLHSLLRYVDSFKFVYFISLLARNDHWVQYDKLDLHNMYSPSL